MVRHCSSCYIFSPIKQEVEVHNEVRNKRPQADRTLHSKHIVSKKIWTNWLKMDPPALWVNLTQLCQLLQRRTKIWVEITQIVLNHFWPNCFSSQLWGRCAPHKSAVLDEVVKWSIKKGLFCKKLLIIYLTLKIIALSVIYLTRHLGLNKSPKKLFEFNENPNSFWG